MKRRENWIRGAIFIGALIIGLIFGAFIVRPPHTANSHIAPAPTATTGVSVMLDYDNGTISTPTPPEGDIGNTGSTTHYHQSAQALIFRAQTTL
ncbi:hypothetical protein M1534_02545 [Patescibacteria group bacterium]|nr:hypothetical protein [Patescibacteria group bacterium]